MHLLGITTDDTWLAPDKAEHLLFCAFIVVAAYTLSVRTLGLGKASSLAAGVVLSLVAASLKELGDYLQWWPGNLSFRDFAADLAGTVLAAAAIIILHKPKASSSSTLAGLANGLRAAGAASATTVPRRPSYIALPTADIEMGTSTAN